MAIINGTPGNDTLISTGIGDALIGGAGDDLYIVNDPADTVAEPQNAGVLIRISVGSEALEADNYSINPIFSADGTKVVFSSMATNLDGGDTNNKQDIFVTGVTGSGMTRVSTDASGVEGNGDSSSASFSADGSKVIFTSQSTNLVSGDTNSFQDIFIKDLNSGAVTRVSTSSTGVQANGVSDLATLSADGSKVVFVSSASNLVAGDTNGKQDIFVKDLNTGVVTRVSTDSSNVQDNGASFTPTFSADGTKVVFASEATNLTAGDTNGAADIFVKNLITGAVTLVSTDSSNAQGNSSSQTPVFSPDGTKVAFVSYSRLTNTDNNGTSDIYIKDLTTGVTTLVTTDALGVQANGFTGSPVFSADGTKLAFISLASNLVPGATNSVGHVFIKDLNTGEVTLVSADEHGVQGNNTSLSASINADGSRVVFATLASNLLNDDNGVADIFIKNVTGGGNDTIESSVSYSLNGNTDNLTLTGTANLTASGNDLYNVITGNSGDNILDGGSGKDTLRGGAGNDIYYVDDAGDVVQETNSGTVTLFSRDSSNVPGNAASDQPVASAHGTNIVFNSIATDLAFNATNGSQHIFSKDYYTGVVTLVSSSASGVQGDAYSFDPSVSSDGSKVAFTSTSDNLVTGDTNTSNDIFVKNLTTGAVTLVSTTSAGVQANNHSGSASISADGSKVAFVSYADNLVAGDSNGQRDIFVKDLNTGALTLVSSSSAGVKGNDFSEMPSISADGTKVVFASSANNLVAGDTNGEEDIFLKDLTTGAISLISADVNGVQGVRDSNTPIFSPDGTKVAFLSSSGNLVPQNFTGYQKLFIKDIATGVVTLVSQASDGTQPDGYSFAPVFSADGTKMAFASYADNLVAGDTNANPDIFVKDLITGAITLVSNSVDGLQSNGFSGYSAFAPDGKLIIASNGDNLLPGLDVNASRDLFVKDLNTDTGGVDTVRSLVTYTLGANLEKLTLLGSYDINGTGNALNNVITGNSGKNVLSGGLGNDTLDGGTGNDTLAGGFGNDVYIVSTSDTIIEGPGGGNDTAKAASSYTLSAYVEKLVLTGSLNINGTGNDTNNTIVGNSGNNILDGFLGNDTLIGGAGNDTYFVSTSDTIIEGVGAGIDMAVAADSSYTLSANVENLTLLGILNLSGTGNDLANGISGNSGNNLLIGGLGNDTLNGGTGHDFFLFNTALNSTNNVDLIVDLTAQDRLQLSHVIFDQAGPVGTLRGSAFVAGAGLTSGQDSSDRIIYNTTDGKLYYDADGSGAGGSVLFAQLGPTVHPHLASVQIQVV